MRQVLIVAVFLAIVCSARCEELGSIQVLELLRYVQSSAEDAQKEVPTFLQIQKAIIAAENDNREFQNQLDQYTGLLDRIRAFDETENMQTIVNWIVDRIAKSTGLIWPLRVARVKSWRAEEALRQLKSDWADCHEKLNRKPDLSDEEQKMEVQLNVEMFAESLENLKKAIVELSQAVMNFEKYVLTEDAIEEDA